ncbi:MAG TPA: type 4a pilus biogenesis protein PilO [Patescibacteria group bacterium]
MFEKIQSLNLRLLWHTRRYFVMAIGLFVLAGLMALLALYRQIMTNLELYGKLNTARERVERLQRKSAQLSQLESSELLQAASQINQSLPSQKPLTPLLIGLNAVSRTAGVTVENVALQPGEVSTDSGTPVARRNGKYDVMELELTVGGTLDQINVFLRDIERFAPFSTVSNLALSKTEAEAATQQFEAELIITTYYFTQSVKVTTDSMASVTLNAGQQQALESIRGFLFPQYDQPTNIQGGGLEDLFGIEEIEVLSQ